MRNLAFFVIGMLIIFGLYKCSQTKSVDEDKSSQINHQIERYV